MKATDVSRYTMSDEVEFFFKWNVNIDRIQSDFSDRCKAVIFLQVSLVTSSEILIECGITKLIKCVEQH